MKKMLAVACIIYSLSLAGCAEMGTNVPMGDLFTKGNPVTVTMEGKGSVKNAVDLFRKVARADGGFVNSVGADSAVATFAVDQLDLQMMADKTDNGVIRVVIQSESKTPVARTFEVGDRMLDVPLKVANDMHGFVIVSKKRSQ